MAKLYFRYGTMDSSKTANALMVRYNYLEKGQHPLILKPKIENRDGEKTIRSRIGISAECDYVEDILEKAEKEWFTGKSDEYKNIDCVIVDAPTSPATCLKAPSVSSKSQTAWKRFPPSAGAARRQSSTRGSRMERWSVPESRS